jgi:hypothetical protein
MYFKWISGFRPKNISILSLFDFILPDVSYKALVPIGSKIRPPGAAKSIFIGNRLMGFIVNIANSRPAEALNIVKLNLLS